MGMFISSRQMRLNFKFIPFASSTLQEIFRTQSWIEPSRTVSHSFFIKVQSYRSSCFYKHQPWPWRSKERNTDGRQWKKIYRAILQPFWPKERRTIFFQQCENRLGASWMKIIKQYLLILCTISCCPIVRGLCTNQKYRRATAKPADAALNQVKKRNWPACRKKTRARAIKQTLLH